MSFLAASLQDQIVIGLTHKYWRCKLRESTSGNKTEVVWSTRYVVDRAHVCRVRVGGWENFEPFLLPKMLLIWCVHSACDPIFGQRPTINSLYVQLWLRTYMCSTTKKPTPFNLIGSMMIIRVLPIHVPPCYEGGYLKPLHWNHIWLMMIIWSDPSMFHDAVRPWSLHIYHYEAMQGQGPISHPQEKPQSTSTGGRGGRGSRWVHYIGGGGGGGACQTWIIYNRVNLWKS